MDKIIIDGGKRLDGRLPISGAKNAALTLLPCALLTDEPLTLRNLPRLADIDGFQHLMNQFGVSTTDRRRAARGFRPGDDAARRRASPATVAPYDLVRKMRASILVLGPMLARDGRGDGVAARRLRDRQPADRPAPRRRSKRSARRSSWPRAMSARWRPTAACRAATTLPGRLGRRDRECADGGGAASGTLDARTTPRASPRSSTCATLLVAMGARDRGHRHSRR